jgi:hypothetical protein
VSAGPGPAGGRHGGKAGAARRPSGAFGSATSMRQPIAEAAEEADCEPGMCVVCWEAPVAVGLVHGSSQHVCVCEACSGRMATGQECPVCMQEVQIKIRAFIP